MATALDVIGDALKLLGIRAAESPVTDVESDDGLVSLNDMLTEWEGDGINIGFELIEDVSETLFLDDGVLGAVKANLAVYIAPEYSRLVTPELALRARNGKRILRSSIESSEFPDSLPIGSGNEDNHYSGDGDSGGDGWGGHFYPANTEKCS